MQKQKLQQMSAYDKKTVHDMFIMTMEWLEKYIETAGYYDDWQTRKQIHENNIIRKDIVGNPEKAKESFSTVLFILQANLQDVPSEFREEIKQEFYRWINAVGIDINNCKSDELKIVLYQVNEILKGNGEKIQKDIENRKREMDPNSPEYMEKYKKMFADSQTPMRNEREVEKTWKDKTDKDWKKEKKFNGSDGKQGEQAFNQIVGTISDQDNFHFFPQQDQQQSGNSSSSQPNNSQQLTGSELATTYDDKKLEHEYKRVQRKLRGELAWDKIDSEQGLKQWTVELEVENIKRHLNEWEIRQVMTFNGLSGRYEEEWKLAMVHQTANLREDNYNHLGRLNIDPSKICFEGSYHFEQLARPKVQGFIVSSQQNRNYSQKLEFQQTDSSNTNNPSISTGTITIIGISLATVATGIFFITKSKKKSLK
jgi:hypothetical protein